MAKAKTCPKCGGSARGRGYAHNAGCELATKKTTTTTTSSGFRIDGRTPIPKLLKWQAEIEEQLKGRKASDVKAVKKAIDEIDALEVRLAEAKQLAGL